MSELDPEARRLIQRALDEEQALPRNKAAIRQRVLVAVAAQGALHGISGSTAAQSAHNGTQAAAVGVNGTGGVVSGAGIGSGSSLAATAGKAGGWSGALASVGKSVPVLLLGVVAATATVARLEQQEAPKDGAREQAPIAHQSNRLDTPEPSTARVLGDETAGAKKASVHLAASPHRNPTSVAIPKINRLPSRDRDTIDDPNGVEPNSLGSTLEASAAEASSPEAEGRGSERRSLPGARGPSTATFPRSTERDPTPGAASAKTTSKAGRPLTNTGPVPDTLSEDLTALRRAHDYLNQGDASRALRELAGVGAPLFTERLALEVLSLCALGEVERAEEKAARFRRLAPESPLAPRVEASCAGTTDF